MDAFSARFFTLFTFSTPERQAGQGFEKALSITPAR